MTYCSSNRGNLLLIIDEVQRAPELISPIRWVVEQSDEKGRIVLSGSRAHPLMKGASESLAGRIRIVELPPLSLRVLGGRLRAAERYGRTMGGCRFVLAFRPRADAHRGGVVPVPPVMVGMAGDEDGHDAASSVERSGTVAGSRRNRTRTEIENVVGDLLARFGSFAAAEVSERVTRVGERTVRRYLAEMVKEGKLVSVPRGRPTTYRAGNSADDLGGGC